MAISYTEHKRKGTPRVRFPSGSSEPEQSFQTTEPSPGIKIQAPGECHSRS